MILFGKVLHRKYSTMILKIIVTIFVITIFLNLVSCNKLEFNPVTTTLKYIIKESKNEQPIK